MWRCGAREPQAGQSGCAGVEPAGEAGRLLSAASCQPGSHRRRCRADRPPRHRVTEADDRAGHPVIALPGRSAHMLTGDSWPRSGPSQVCCHPAPAPRHRGEPEFKAGHLPAARDDADGEGTPRPAACRTTRSARSWQLDRGSKVRDRTAGIAPLLTHAELLGGRRTALGSERAPGRRRSWLSLRTASQRCLACVADPSVGATGQSYMQDHPARRVQVPCSHCP